MKNKFLYFVLLISVELCFVNCSSDDSDDNVPISVNFLIQDESGAEKYTFKEGENIFFCLVFTNNDTETVVLPSTYDIFDSDVFHVYAFNGEDMGKPYDVLFAGPEITLRIEARGKIIYLCPWINDPNSDLNNPELHLLKPYYLACRIDNPRPLPKGEYYSKFSLLLDKKRVTCQKSFKIE